MSLRSPSGAALAALRWGAALLRFCIVFASAPGLALANSTGSMAAGTCYAVHADAQAALCTSLPPPEVQTTTFISSLHHFLIVTRSCSPMGDGFGGVTFTTTYQPGSINSTTGVQQLFGTPRTVTQNIDIGACQLQDGITWQDSITLSWAVIGAWAAVFGLMLLRRALMR